MIPHIIFFLQSVQDNYSEIILYVASCLFSISFEAWKFHESKPVSCSQKNLCTWISAAYREYFINYSLEKIDLLIQAFK